MWRNLCRCMIKPKKNDSLKILYYRLFSDLIKIVPTISAKIRQTDEENLKKLGCNWKGGKEGKKAKKIVIVIVKENITLTRYVIWRRTSPRKRRKGKRN